MKFKGIYKQKYTVDKEAKELVVEVKLLQREGMIEAGQNLYYGVATANDKDVQHKSLPTCVNAEFMAERIGKEIIQSWKIRAKKVGKTFRIKKK
jgi:hypothetical protein